MEALTSRPLAPGYRELPPPLGGALECLWVRVVPPSGAEPILVLPDSCSDLIWQAGRGAFVAGPDTAAVLAPAAPGTVMVGARFLPGAGGPALGMPLSEVRDLRVEVADLLPRLEAWLPPTLPPEVALRRVAAAAARLASAGPPDLAVRRAAQLLADPLARVEELAGDLGLSERQLRRRFHASVGYGPKTLQRVLRFRDFLARVDAAGARPDLARIAVDAGYADQAHLTHECTRLAGMPPARLVEARAEAWQRSPLQNAATPVVEARLGA
jgi:AraC-like DNA-binding protein